MKDANQAYVQHLNLMEIGDAGKFYGGNLEVLRVPGGWIYIFSYGEKVKSSVFVPHNIEGYVPGWVATENTNDTPSDT